VTAASRIRLLPDGLVARIAAGEVVERPASALKELIENSLDAGATRVTVSIEGAGRRRLAIADNGCGMTPAEARLSLERHATSKISCLEDLESIRSFGFRGEALPSIAAVSRLTLTTRAAGEESGWEIELEGGKIVSEHPVAREPGTTIEVRDLFYNTPARFKFLKSDGAERGHCLRVIEEAAFAAPAVTFDIRNEGGKPVVFRGGEPAGPAALEVLRSRLGEAWGSRWGRDVVRVAAENPHFAVMGLVTNQGFHQASARNQFLYINRRPVQNRRLSRAVYEAFVGQLPSLRHPGWVLFLAVDPATIDVNVHPSKREVKLTHESELFGFLLSSVRAALSADRPAPVFSMAPAAAEPGSPPPSPVYAVPDRSKPMSARSETRARYDVGTARIEPDLFSPAAAVEDVRPELADLRDPDLTVLGQVRRTFIVAHTSGGLLVADQHAAAEKVAYERLLANTTSAAAQIQMLLVPFTWEVAMSMAPRVQDSLEIWRRMGFLIEPFGGSTFVVKGLPSHLGDRFDIHVLLDAMCDALAEPGERRGTSLEHRLAAAAACKASVKAGDPLDNAGARRILAELAACQSPFTCPHGRPTVIRWGFGELETRFRRR
jgi:DNA mismatch repair protein MutL